MDQDGAGRPAVAAEDRRVAETAGRAACTTVADGQLVRLSLAGVAAGSPFGTLASAVLDGHARLMSGGDARAASSRWRRVVAGTGLQWWADEPGQGADASCGADITVVLHAEAAPSAGRVWRIVDASGAPLLEAFHGLGACYRPPFVASLYLIGREGVDGSWDILAEAHLSSAVGYGSLLGAVARAAALLLRTAVLGRSRAGPAWRAASRPALPRLALTRARAAAGLAWLCARLGGDLYGIALMERGAAGLLAGGVLAPEHWVSIPPHVGFVADPFFWPGYPGVAMCEVYTHRSGRGAIGLVATGPQGAAVAMPNLLRTESHLSYPFTWQDGDRVLCVPEMAATRRQDLYELPPGGPMRRVCTIADDVAMADPTVMWEDGRYWLAYTDADIGAYDNLCLMFSDHAEGPWHKHPGNPVKIDARSSRPGGVPFRVGERLLRPAQDCSRTYGGALVLNEVLRCTPTDYAERPVATLRADPDGPFPDGVHTISVRDGQILIDGKRVSYHPMIVIQKMLRRLPIWRTIRWRSGTTGRAASVSKRFHHD